MSDRDLLRVLTIFDIPEEAEQLINVLRNAGQIVRDIRAEDDEDMETALNENPFDVILAKQKLGYFSAKEALEVINKSGKDIPLIVIQAGGESKTPSEELNAGARDAIALSDTERLLHSVKREVESLKQRKQLRRNEQMLHESEKRARSLIDNSRDAIAYVHDGMHIYANQAYMDMFGYDELDDIEGIPILDMVSGNDHSTLKEFLRNYAKGQTEDDRLNVEAKHTDGHTFKMNMEFTPASMEGEACTQIIIRDQSDSKQLEQQLNVLSKQDVLTGLYNRSYFLEQAEKLISQAVVGKNQGIMLLMELDNFDAARNSIGIGPADELLVKIAQLLKEKLEKFGILARLEGAEYTLLLNNTNLQKGEEFAAGIVKLINDHTCTISGKVINSTVSIGITHINETVPNLQDCINRAEKGCAVSKESGGNQYNIFNPSLDDLEEEEQASHWAHKIKEALRNNQFKLLFQPVVSLHGISGSHYEVLIRMLDDDGNEVPPQEFIEAANRADLTKFIDRWVIANTFKLLTERDEQGLVTRFFIKVSQGSITDAEFLPWISERIQSLNLDTASIIFQFNEETALNHLTQTKTIIDGFKALNCRTALENFGIEENTFQSMNQLPVDFIKIHADVIKNLAQSVEHQEKVKEIADNARDKNMQTIAAFVEDANSLAVLWQCSVDFIQGHFLQQPESELNYEFESAF